MAKKGPIAQAVGALDLPAELAKDTVKMILTGNEDILVYNHGGILVYEPERIVFRYQKGLAAVSGNGLSLTELTGDGLRIAGEIHGVYLKETKHEH